MKCDHCKKGIDETVPHEVTTPDGDCFHKVCYSKHKKERDKFFNEIVHDDKKFNNWMKKLI